jgi:peptidoglycan hydrolase-like protein with peptidoglycan-binding domain
VKEQQENLLTLGFDVGKADGFKGQRTRQAIAEFRALYLPDTARHLQDAELAVIIEIYANLARRDAARYGIDHGIVAAIRLSSVRTGVDFSYLMKLAATESNFEPASKAATSSATGLYQFTHDTWLNTLKMHGTTYGLVADYAAKIEYYETRSGYQRPMVRDQSLYQHLLALRKNPRLSSMMAAETVRDNQQKLAHSLNREPTETDLYLTHFLGTDNAITFLRSLQQSPGTHAVELFPRAASSNYDIFHPRSCEPRTVDEVYALFDEKLSTRRYDDFAAN